MTSKKLSINKCHASVNSCDILGQCVWEVIGVSDKCFAIRCCLGEIGGCVLCERRCVYVCARGGRTGPRELSLDWNKIAFQSAFYRKLH